MRKTILVSIAFLFMAASATSAWADYLRGRGPKGAKGNQCHCNDNSGGMDCICGISVSPDVAPKVTLKRKSAETTEPTTGGTPSAPAASAAPTPAPKSTTSPAKPNP